MKIPGGYILKARKTLESELMDKPPLWSKLWDWMLLRAEWRDGQKIQRGQFHTTIADMREAMSWHVGYRKVMPTFDEVRRSYEGLVHATMIAATKTTRGVLITVCNYDKYQDPKNYERHNERHNENGTKAEFTPHDSKEVKKEERSKIPPSEVARCDESPLAAVPSAEVFIIIPLNGPVDHPVTMDDLREYESLYGNVDVPAALRKMRGHWLSKAKSQRKTQRGIKTSINTWLARDQDRAPSRASPNDQFAPRNFREAKEVERKETATSLMKDLGLIHDRPDTGSQGAKGPEFTVAPVAALPGRGTYDVRGHDR